MQQLESVKLLEKYNNFRSKYIINIDEYTYYSIIDPKFTINDNLDIKYSIISKNLNSDAKIPLYVMVGLSNNSIFNNLQIIERNLEKIKDKYNKLIFFIIEDTNIQKKYIGEETDEQKVWELTDNLKQIIATHYNNIIRKINNKFNYDKIDLIGVSFSGGIAVFISSLQNNLQIRNLILVAPAIKKGLSIIPNDQHIILGWCYQDTKVPYETIGKQFIEEVLKKADTNEIVLTDLKKENVTDNETHRLQDDLTEDKIHRLQENFTDDETHRLQDNLFNIL
jgi:hypothetical protein